MKPITTLLRKLPGFGKAASARSADRCPAAMSEPVSEPVSAPTSDRVSAPSSASAPSHTSAPSFNNAPSYTSAPAPLRRRTPRTPRTAPDAATHSHLHIPCPDPTVEDRLRDRHRTTALRLARQEDWSALAAAIAEADSRNAMTPGGMSIAELMSFGARADVVMAADHALMDKSPAPDAPLMSGIEALEYVLAEHPTDTVIACIVAQTHIDMGWAWRGAGWDAKMAPRNREAFEAHFARAREIMAHCPAAPYPSPLHAATLCALLPSAPPRARTVADSYERLIDLNPLNIAPMRALGTHMLPRWYGSYTGLELEARRTAARTQGIWGAGGYSWVMFDAISNDATACAQLDLPLFTEGLRDILARRPEPYTANLLAAYCAITMESGMSGEAAADANRAQIAACADWIVREHLTELHPMIWAHAARGFVNNIRIGSAQRFAAAGRDDALRIISGLFTREIAEGKRIIFTTKGPVATPSGARPNTGARPVPAT